MGVILESVYDHEAGVALAGARRDAARGATFGSAVVWLRRNGFYVLDIGGGPIGFRGGGNTQLKTITGLKRLGTRGPLIGDKWIELEYQFTEEGKFRGIVLDRWAAPPPRFIRAAVNRENSTRPAPR